LNRKNAITSLEAETKHVMLDVGKSFLNNKMEEPHSSNTPEIVMEVSNNVFTSPPAPQPPLLTRILGERLVLVVRSIYGKKSQSTLLVSR